MLDIISECAKEILWGVFDEHKDLLIDAAKNVVSDTTKSILTGKKTIDEWAEIVIKGIDKVKEQAIAEENWQYAGGKLCFQISDKSSKYVVISFQLYFLDENNEWKKTEASRDKLASNFTSEAIEELKTKGKVEFEVEG